MKPLAIAADAAPPPLPPIEAAYEHLSSRWLWHLARHTFRPQDAVAFLVTVFPEACEAMQPYARYFRQGNAVYFSTGGWSGCEELLDAMLRHFWIRELKVQWRRGGHYIFELPEWWLNKYEAKP